MRKLWISLSVLVALVGTVALAGWLYWRGFALDAEPQVAKPGSLAELSWMPTALPRGADVSGRILAVISSHAVNPKDGRSTGYELTELSRAYALFLAHGLEVDIASPAGGRAPMKLDDELTEVDHAFLNDPTATKKREQSLALRDVNPRHYVAVYFVGGKGTMFDFADNPDLIRVGNAIWQRGGVIAAVCHGPAALIGLSDVDGSPLLRGRRVTGFSNDEERFILPDADRVLPFMLEDRMRALGARFEAGPKYLDHTIAEGRLITGQNPWSTWSTAEAVLAALQVQAIKRPISNEENAIALLQGYHAVGPDFVKTWQPRPVDRHLLLMHAIVAGMEGRWRDAYHLQALARPGAFKP